MEVLSADAAAKEPEKPKPEPPPGQCQSCGAFVKRADIEHLPDHHPTHRVKRSRSDLLGDVCGPVATGWVYHLVFSGRDGRLRRASHAIPCPIEAPGALDALEGRLTLAKYGDAPGEAVEVLDWKLMGHTFGHAGKPS